MFNTSILQLLPYQPYKTDTLGNVTETLDGVFIMADPNIIVMLKEGLSPQKQAEIDSYLWVVTVQEAGEWHVPVWAGETGATYVRVPSNVWNDPLATPPQRIKTMFKHLWNEVNG